jgi:hypothetical protein
LFHRNCHPLLTFHARVYILLLTTQKNGEMNKEQFESALNVSERLRYC